MMPRSLLLLISLGFASPSVQASDAFVTRQLDSHGLRYEIDSDGDYKVVLPLEAGRSQLVLIRSTIEEFGSLRIREIWSPGLRIEGNTFPTAVANRLLTDSNEAKTGAWVRQKNLAMFVVKIDASSRAEQLFDAITAAALTADRLEQELTLGKDEF